MAEAVDIQKLRSFLTCSICLDNFDNPKRLTCSHLFCKCCLEDLVEFSPDGTALIQCPLRCKVQTFLDDNETLDDLPPSYEIKGILEALELGKRSPTPQSVLCKYHHECGREVSLYCCGNLLCSKCAGEHEKCWKDHDDRKRLIFDKREGKLFVLCEGHASKCTHICEDNTFLCMYCITRFHKDHEMDSVDSAAALVRETLLKDSRNMNTLRILINKTEDHIRDAKRKLDDLLRERKLEKLLNYIELLNKEEERIKRTFQSIADDHIKQYPDSMQGEYYGQKLLKEDITLAIEKEPIMDIIADCNLDNFHVSPLTISLPDPYDPRSQHMLGELKVDVGRRIAMENLSPISPTFRDTMRPFSRYDALSDQLIDEVRRISSRESLIANNNEEIEASSSEERDCDDMLKNMLGSLRQRTEGENPNQGSNGEATPAEPSTSSEDAVCSNSNNGNSHEICFALSINHTTDECLPTPSTSQRGDNIQLSRSSYKSPLFPLHSSKRRTSPPNNFILPSRFDTSKYISSPMERHRNDVGAPVTSEDRYAHCSRYNANLSTHTTCPDQSPWRQRPNLNIEVSADSPSQRFDTSSRPRSSHASLNDISRGASRYFSNYSPSNAAAELLNSSELEEEVIHIKARTPSRVIKTIPFCPTAIEDLRVGMKVSVNRSRPMLSRGTVKWTGTLPGHTGDYVGLELDVESGKHNGLFNGVQYFSCKAERGIFVKLSKVIMAWK